MGARQHGKEFPTIAELADKVDTRGYRRGTGKLFMHDRNIQNPDPGNTSKVRRLQPMPEKPTLIDFFKLRFGLGNTQHLMQSARLAQKRGESEKIVLACLLHDIGNSATPTMATEARRSSSPCRAGRLRDRYRKRCASIRHSVGSYQAIC